MAAIPLSIDLPEGGTTKLESVAKIYEAVGPNTNNREQVRRRIILQCNTAGRGLVDVVEDIKTRLKPIVASLPAGYLVEYEGESWSRDMIVRPTLFWTFGLAAAKHVVDHDQVELQLTDKPTTETT